MFDSEGTPAFRSAQRPTRRHAGDNRHMRFLTVAWLVPCFACAANLIETSAQWQNWSPRPALRPVFEDAGGKLAIRSRKFADYGKWVSPPLAVQGGAFYRFQVQYRTASVKDESAA
jgi:hypothetical protein